MTISAAPAPARRRGLRAALGAGALLALACVAWPQTVSASGQHSSSYEGSFSSTDPSGYSAAPASHLPGDQVTYQFTVTNNALTPQTLTYTPYVERVTRVGGQDVSTGSPPLDEATILKGPDTGDAPAQGDPVSNVIYPQLSVTYTITVPVAQCGDIVIWAGQAPSWSDATTVLNAGATRVTGCPAATPRPSPPTTAAPTPSPPPASSPPAAPTPSGSSPAPVALHPAPPASATPASSPSPSPAASPTPSASPSPSPAPSPSPSASASPRPVAGIVVTTGPSQPAPAVSAAAPGSAFSLSPQLESLVAVLFVGGFCVGLVVLVVASLRRPARFAPEAAPDWVGQAARRTVGPPRATSAEPTGLGEQAPESGAPPATGSQDERPRG